MKLQAARKRGRPVIGRRFRSHVATSLLVCHEVCIFPFRESAGLPLVMIATWELINHPIQAD